MMTDDDPTDQTVTPSSVDLGDLPQALELERQLRRLVGHEVKNSLRSVQVAVAKISRFVGELPETVRRPRALENWISDAEVHLSDIAVLISELSDENFAYLTTKDEIVLASALERARTSVNAIADFWFEFNTSIHSMGPQIEQRRLRLVIASQIRGLKLRIHPENMRLIFNNIVENAIKYSLPNTPLICGTVEQPYSIRFFIRNQAASLEEGEASRIFSVSYRGRHAQQSGERGAGIGLYVVRRICQFHDADASYEPRPVTREEDQERVWHEFRVDFPRSLVA